MYFNNTTVPQLLIYQMWETFVCDDYWPIYFGGYRCVAFEQNFWDDAAAEVVACFRTFFKLGTILPFSSYYYNFQSMISTYFF